MSRCDYFFFNNLGHRHKDIACENEKKHDFVLATENFLIASKCFKRAAEIAGQECIRDDDANLKNFAFCQQKIAVLSEKTCGGKQKVSER